MKSMEGVHKEEKKTNIEGNILEPNTEDTKGDLESASLLPNLHMFRTNRRKQDKYLR